ncbi:MAG: TIGR00300 family protein [bacterium]|nr:TIGR00300 family protein [bacterium]
MCPPDFYAIDYVINPWMEGNVGRTCPEAATGQWRRLYDRIRGEGGEVELLRPVPGRPDLVFTANAGLALGGKALAAHFRHRERQAEEPIYKEWFEGRGFEVVELPRGIYFEGAGDALPDRGADLLWLGYGIRTVLDACVYVAEEFDIEVVPLRLVDPRFYHLDTCLAPLAGGRMLYYPAAFDERSRRLIETRVSADRRLAVGELDALHFACNCVEIGSTLILHDCSEALERRLAEWDYAVARITLSEFLLAGGSARCLCLRLNEGRAPRAAAPRTEYARRTVSFQGHLLDSGLLAEVLDLITRGGGTFETLEFRPGPRHEDPSYLRLAIGAPTAGALDQLLAHLMQQGGRLDEGERQPAQLAVVEQDGVAPEDFYSTTIYPTDVCVGGGWVRVSGQRMDGVIVVDEGGGDSAATARVVLMRDLRRGQKVVVGVEGLRVHATTEAREERGEFRFMASAVSSERRVEQAVEAIAWEMRQIRRRGGRIVWVPGPVVVHTGGIPYLCELARRGYVQAVLAGNALAVHDIELALYGTSLGVDLRRGVALHGGHRHHLKAINAIRRCGGIAAAVGQGMLGGGLMYELVRHRIPFSLAGSIRDDGPLPETRMNLIDAQAEYARLLEGAEMIMMLSTMLHSIGVGNMTPAGVKMVCVDINPAVATKLADRGSFESRPVVTDVGLFLNLLARKIESLEAESRQGE